MKRYLLVALLAFTLFSISSAQEVANEQSVDSLIQNGINHHDNRDFKQAIKSYKKALDIDSTSTIATYELALSYLALRDFDNAAKYSSKVIDADDENLLIGAYGIKSESLAETGEIDKAISLLEGALIILGNNYYLHFNLALNYYNKNNLDKTIFHVDNALNLNKSQSAPYLLSAYALRDKERWVQSILSFQLFLLMEPDSHRSRNAFKELLQTMQLKEISEKPIERSFIQKQLKKHSQTNKKDSIKKEPLSLALGTSQGINRKAVYDAIETTKDSLEVKFAANDSISADSTNTILYNSFKEVTRSIFTSLSEQNDGTKKGIIWSFHVPVITKILNSNYFDTYCRYISVAYFPESLKWWENNQQNAAKFVRWFEKGDEHE